MKRLTYILLLLTATSAFAGAFIKDAEPAMLEVRYTRTEVYDTLHRDSLFFKDEMMLRIGRTKTMFCNVKQFFHDSLLKVNPDASWAMLAAEIDKGNPNVFATLQGHKRSYLYKDHAKNQITEEDYFDMTPWRYREEIEIPVWDIEDETKMILGYECNKAVTDFRGRKWTAWFAPDIPIQEWPWKLCGLPGLILEATDNSGLYNFTATGIQQTERPMLPMYSVDDYEKMSRIDFLKAKRQFIDNPLATMNTQLSASGITIGLST